MKKNNIHIYIVIFILNICFIGNYAQTRSEVDGLFNTPANFVMPNGTSGITWKYFQTDDSNPPASSWYQTSFDDSGWSSGQAGFYQGAIDGDVPTTLWTTSQLYLRGTFTVDASEIDNLVFWTRWDDLMTIYINGVEAYNASQWSEAYRYLGISAAAKATISSTSTNTIAVYVQDNGGGRYFDLGLVNEPAMGSRIESGFSLNPDLDALGDQVKDYMILHGIPAGVFALRKGDDLLVAKGYGFKDKGFTEALDYNAVMRLASVDKIVTHDAATKFISEAHQDPDGIAITGSTKVFPLLAKYGLQPGFGINDTRINDITIDNLIDFKSGLDDLPDPEAFCQDLGISADAADIHDNAAWLYSSTLRRNPGITWEYISSGHMLLRYIIHQETGDLETYLQNMFAESGYSDVYIAYERLDGRQDSEPWYATLYEPYDRWIQLENYTALASSAPALVMHQKNYTPFHTPYNGAIGGTWSVLTHNSSEDYSYTVLFNMGGTYNEVEQGIDNILANLQASSWEITRSAIPGKIEAEDYSDMSGIQTQATSDVGGGENVGWINAGDWMDYEVNVQTAGTYNVDFRVASLSNNIMLDLKEGSTVLTSVNSSTTGGWQNWTTVSQTVNLSAGQTTLRVLATGGGWNINWMEFASGSSSSGGSSSGGSSSGGSSSGGSSSGGSSSGGSSSGGSSSGSTFNLGNPSTSDATHDGWKSNMVINETDTYTNNSGSTQTIEVNTFNFYAWRAADPVTPFVVRVNADNDFTVLAVGTTRENTAYNVGNNSVAFNTGTVKTITLNDNEKLATGFLDAHADGTGGSTGSVIPFDGTSPDQIWYTGGSAASNAGQVAEGAAPTSGANVLTNLTRNYHFNIDFTILGGSSSGGSSSGGSSSGGSSSGGSSSGGSSSGGSSSGGSSSGCTGSSVNVEAESFTSTGGTYDDSSAGGPGLGANSAGSTINYVNSGDWMDYTVNIPAAGDYSISYQISSPINGSTIQITGGGSSITTTVPNNGSWDSYQTLDASGTLNLSAGSQTIRLTAGAQTWTWNLDKFTLACAAKDAAENIATDITKLSIYPNPVNDELNVVLEGTVNNGAQIMIYQSTGSLVRTVSVEDNEIQLNTSKLSNGMYILKVINGSEVISKTFFKN